MKFGCKVMGPVPVVRGLGKQPRATVQVQSSTAGRGQAMPRSAFPSGGDQDPLGLLPATILHLRKHTGIPQPTRPMQLSIAADLLIVLGCDLPQENARHSTRCVCESATVKKGEKIETGAADRTR